LSGLIAKALNDFLKKVYLNGTIENCKITTYKDGFWVIEAVDNLSFVMVFCQAEIITDTEYDLGIGDINLLIKWLKTVGNNEITIKKKDNKITFKSKQNGKLVYLLSELDSILTQLPIEDDDKTQIDQILELTEFKTTLTKKISKNIISNIKIVKSELTYLVVKNGEVSFKIGGEDTHQVLIPVGIIKDKISFELSIHGKSLFNVLSVIDGDSSLLFAENLPLIIKQDDNNIYGLNIVQKGD
jgi:hypothetical protein